MDELKLLIEMVAGLPTLAIWVLVGYLVYKLVLVGSIYSFLRFCVDKLHDWLKTERSKTCVVKMDQIGCINPQVADSLRIQFTRLIENSTYSHSSDVDKLRQAIDKMKDKSV